MSAATAISALFWLNAARVSPCVSARGSWEPALIRALPRGALVAGEEFGFLHELLVARFLFRHPVGVLLALERGRVERALLHELLPFGRLLDLVQEIDVVLDLLRRGAAGHEDAAQHQIVDLETLLLA